MPSSNASKPIIPTNRLKYHRRSKIKLADAQIPKLTQESRRCLQNLASYRAPRSQLVLPRSRCAAVLVALFVGRMGDLYVLLSRRATTLRTYAGDTSLPGGKVDPSDKSLEDTARREAFEEVPLLCILKPFLAAELIVTPVVVLILDNTLRPILNSSEVASLFSHPLASFLTTIPPFPSEPESVEVPYHTSFDFYSSGPNGEKEYTMKVHQFLTGREAGGIKPVYGLTAGMLIRVANIGYGREPDFEWHAPNAPTMEQRIAWALLSRPVFNEACKREKVDLRRARKVLGLKDDRDRRRSVSEIRKDENAGRRVKSKL
ncbi:hypothetical protein BDQ17DRAFT_1390265 [Cyathus striatus]|nr:hypothetical protein BDQ17DRAFT_1390265 [Cyathus striatus]